MTSPWWSTLGVLVVMGFVECAVGYAIGFLTGIQKGRELQAMEPPRYGEMRPHDGLIVPVYAPQPDLAVERLTQDRRPSSVWRVPRTPRIWE